MGSSRSLTVALGSSMFPLIPDKSLLEVEEVPKKNLRRGDIVVFRAHPHKVCHRILSIRHMGNATRFFIKGDSQLSSDGWIEAERLIGRVVSVNGRRLSATPYALLSKLLYWHSKAQWTLFQWLFCSALGQRLGQARRRFFPRPLCTPLFSAITAPWWIYLRCSRKVFPPSDASDIVFPLCSKESGPRGSA